MLRLADIAYTAEGKAVTDQLWEETLDEFEFIQARRLVESFRT